MAGQNPKLKDTATANADAETVLVVEDEVLIRMVISDYLRGCGYRVIEAASGDEALAVLQHGELKLDIVFSDIEMPGATDGFGLSNWIRNNRPDLDVILTGSVPRAVNAAVNLCEDAPLPKPYESQSVADRIHRLLAARATRKKGG